MMAYPYPAGSANGAETFTTKIAFTAASAGLLNLNLNTNLNTNMNTTINPNLNSNMNSNTYPNTRPMTSAESQPARPPPKQLVERSGRHYHADPSLRYPLPVDLAELNRQSLRTLLLIQVFGLPVCSPTVLNKPPSRVLDVGCGFGFWSIMCHRYFKARGHGNISFTGVDLAPLALDQPDNPVSGPGPSGASRPDCDMRWRYVQHDIRQIPFPLQADEFDLIMVKDMGLATTDRMRQPLMDEYVRLLRPGGILEVWESDHTIRMLRPHVPTAASPSSDDEEELSAAAALGTYLVTANTTLSAPVNDYLLTYNGWITSALEMRGLSPVPCTLIGAMLLQESESLCDVRSRRLAVPLSEMRWERDGVDNVVTTDGKTYHEWSRASSASALTAATSDSGRRELSAGQAALRRTALLTVVQQIQSLELALREVGNKSQDEWDGWIGKMMNDLLKDEGTVLGECLEVGAWWARKKKSSRR